MMNLLTETTLTPTQASLLVDSTSAQTSLCTTDLEPPVGNGGWPKTACLMLMVTVWSFQAIGSTMATSILPVPEPEHTLTQPSLLMVETTQESTIPTAKSLTTIPTGTQLPKEGAVALPLVPVAADPLAADVVLFQCLM